MPWWDTTIIILRGCGLTCIHVYRILQRMSTPFFRQASFSFSSFPSVIWLTEVWSCLCWLTVKLSARQVQHYLCFLVKCPRNCCLVMVSLKSLFFNNIFIIIIATSLRLSWVLTHLEVFSAWQWAVMKLVMAVYHFSSGTHEFAMQCICISHHCRVEFS